MTKLKSSCRSAFLLVLIVPIAHIYSGITMLHAQDQTDTWGISLQWRTYQSFSQQKNELPIKLGYPVFESDAPVMGLHYEISRPGLQHQFYLNASLPASLTSDDGRGTNYLLQNSQSSYFRTVFDYRLVFPLYQWKGLSARHAVVGGLLYERRTLEYKSDASETTRDLNFYVGPGLQLQYQFFEQFSLSAIFDARFYLPYANYGYFKSEDTQGNDIFSTHYHGFYYQTIFTVEGEFALTDSEALAIGLKKNDIIGFANRSPLFKVNNLATYKLDRLFHYYITYKF